MKKAKTMICAAILIATVSLSATVIAVKHFRHKDETIAYVYSNDILIKTIDLDSESEPYTFTVTSENGGYNIIEVKDGKIGITQASCPDGVCINTGYINSSLLPIVCLPNKLIIEVRSSESNDNIDAVTN